MTALPQRPLAVGDTVHGFCGGIFGRDSYSCKTVEARGTDWAVFRTTEGGLALATRQDLRSLREYRSRPNETTFDFCTCAEGADSPDEVW